jgi:hypothetical protein
VSGYEPVEWVPLSEVRDLIAKGEIVSGPKLIGLLLAGAVRAYRFVLGGSSVITLADAVPGDEVAVAALCAELGEFYGSLPEGLPAERGARVRDVLFGDPPLARALVAWDGEAPAGFAAYSFLWPAVGLTASLYLKELYVAEALGARPLTSKIFYRQVR